MEWIAFCFQSITTRTSSTKTKHRFSFVHAILSQLSVLPLSRSFSISHSRYVRDAQKMFLIGPPFFSSSACPQPVRLKAVEFLLPSCKGFPNRYQTGGCTHDLMTLTVSRMPSHHRGGCFNSFVLHPARSGSLHTTFVVSAMRNVDPDECLQRPARENDNIQSVDPAGRRGRLNARSLGLPLAHRVLLVCRVSSFPSSLTLQFGFHFTIPSQPEGGLEVHVVPTCRGASNSTCVNADA